MTFNILLTGVGGEGVLVTSVIIGRAAQLEGHEVRGTQLHGLAQRGGSIPTHLRFGRSVHSPLIRRGQADLILGLEPIEAARALRFASRGRTNFVIDTYPIIPVYAALFRQSYPDSEAIKRMIEPFAKRVVLANASNICRERLGHAIYGNVMAIGIAVSAGMLPLRRDSILKALKKTAPRGLENNLAALKLGLDFKP